MGVLLNRTIYSASEEDLRIFIFRRYLLIVSAIYVIGAVLELFVDFKSATVGFFGVVIAFSLGMLGLSVLNVRHSFLVTSTMVFSMLVNEIQLLINPLGYHALVYWIALMPLIVTVLVQQVRYSFFWIGAFVIMIVGHGWYLQKSVGSYTAEVVPARFMAAGILLTLLTSSVAIFFSYLLVRSRRRLQEQNETLADLKAAVEQQNKALKTQRDSLDSKNANLESYINTILDLSRSKEVVDGEFGKAVEKVCSTLCDVIKVSRVSYWSYNPEQDSIACRYMFPAHFFREITHKLQEFPVYGQQIKEKKIIAAKNVMVDPTTVEFCKHYLKEHQVCSMMDSPLVINGQLVGIICCENIDEEHEWRAEEMLLVSSICDILTISYKALQNREYIEEIRVKNLELSAQAAKISIFNEELQAMNENLEDRVQERTRALEEQNAQLAEYAFINSHLLRAPLSRILGLINLINASDLSHRERELMRHLHESGRQLDDIVHRISNMLDKGYPLTRDELVEKNNSNG